MSSPATYENIQIVPLVVKMSNRDATLTQDAWMKNVVLEQGDDGPISVKRPGLGNVANLTSQGLASYAVEGMGSWGADAVVIVNNKVLPVTAIVQAPTVAASLGTLAAPGQASADRFRVLWETAMQAPAFLAMQGSSRYVYTYGRLGNGIEYFDTQAGFGVVGNLKPSLCQLDNTWYVMDDQGRIVASAIGDITNWPALNYVQLDAGIETGVCLHRHLNYLLAFGVKGILAYYDAGNPTGAPILPVPNATFTTGMTKWGGFTVAEIDDNTYWLGRGAAPGFSVYRMVGLTVGSIATPSIERLLSAYFRTADTDMETMSATARIAAPRGFTFKSSGHTYYILTSPTYTNSTGIVRPGITLSYCVDMNHWTVWTQQVGSSEMEFQPMGSVTLATMGYSFMADSNGNFYNFDQTIYQDNGLPINVLIQTDLFNWGNQRTKLIAATYPLLDTVNTTVYLSWTDNDYQTFCTPQAIATSTAKKQLIRCGSTVQRAWLLTHTDNTPMRFYQLEVEVIPGAL